MATAAYDVELMWEDQKWLVHGFFRLTGRIGEEVAGTF